MSVEFLYDSRLGIYIPRSDSSWGDLNGQSQEQILNRWESIRGSIPDRIKEIEFEIEIVHEQLTLEESFDRSCELNFQMAELASIINDLWIWFRLTPTLTS